MRCAHVFHQRLVQATSQRLWPNRQRSILVSSCEAQAPKSRVEDQDTGRLSIPHLRLREL